jgi:hypothetical protein
MQFAPHGEAIRRFAGSVLNQNEDNELHVYLDSFDECLLRIETVAALLADELPKYQLDRMKIAARVDRFGKPRP